MNWRSLDGTLNQDCVVIYRVRDAFGGLSNMAGGYPLLVNGIVIPSSEALYQACRFPHRPEWQAEIISQSNPMTAKMVAKKDGRRAHQSRPDWAAIELDVMAWALRVKLAWHYRRLAELLLTTDDRPIVEKSRTDDKWGAIEICPGCLEGDNRLGRLLMDLRTQVRTRSREELAIVEPLPIRDFTLLGEPIRRVRGGDGAGA